MSEDNKKKSSNQPEAGLLPIGAYKMPFRLKASGILFPDGTLQTTAADGSGGGGGSDPGLGSEIDAIKEEQVTQNNDIANNTSDIADIKEEITNLQAGGDSGLGSDIADIKAEQETQNNDIASNTSDIADIKAEQETQNDGIDSNTFDIADIKTEQKTQDSKISANEGDITAIKAEQKTQDGKISANEGDITAIKAEQKTQDGKILANEGDITAIKAEQKTQDGKILANETAIAENKKAIADNKKAIEANKGAIEVNAQDIIELEEEIEAIAPSFERGIWNSDLDTNHPRPPAEGQIYFGDGLQKITDYADVKEIFIHNKDASSTRQNHTWGDVEVGQMIEFFDEKDSDFLLAKITEVQTQTDYAYIKVDVLKYEGGHDENPLRMKIFTIAETEVDLSSFPTLGGDNEFNGKQEFNKNVTIKGFETVIQPQLSSRWHKFNVTPPKNENGTNNTTEAYGVEFYLDSGNTWKNQFKISNRNGVAFSVRGGEDLNGQLHKEWKYSGPQAEDDHLATVKYVTDAVEGIDIPEVDLTGYATETYVDTAIENIDIPQVDTELFMPKSGGTFTGNVATGNGSITIKTGNKSTGTNFSVTNGNSVQQLYLNGYGNFEYDKSATSSANMTSKTVATMGDIELHTLASSDNMSYKSPTSLNNYDFATDRNGANSITKVYLYKLKNNTNNMVYVSDYEPTPSTVFTIYYPSSGEIVFSTLVKNWQTSSYSTYQIMFDTPNYGNFYKLGYSLSSSSSYRLMLTNLRKK